jgi:hypothetical protein
MSDSTTQRHLCAPCFRVLHGAYTRAHLADGHRNEPNQIRDRLPCSRDRTEDYFPGTSLLIHCSDFCDLHSFLQQNVELR